MYNHNIAFVVRFLDSQIRLSLRLSSFPQRFPLILFGFTNHHIFLALTAMILRKSYLRRKIISLFCSIVPCNAWRIPALVIMTFCCWLRLLGMKAGVPEHPIQHCIANNQSAMSHFQSLPSSTTTNYYTHTHSSTLLFTCRYYYYYSIIDHPSFINSHRTNPLISQLYSATTSHCIL
jgi:hypothetical protein